MPKEQFTPGPWHSERHSVVDAQGEWIADVAGDNPNTRLIAEAPEMFRLLQVFAGREYAFPDYVAARALIARVLGVEVPHGE
jgi:hypothetical protein